MYLDRAFYEVANYVWAYPTNTGFSPNKLTTAHRSILHARKSKDSQMYKDQIAEDYRNPTDKRIRRLIKDGSRGRMPYSWRITNQVKNVSKIKGSISHHPCVIPDDITALFISGMTKPRDVVVIPYAGSGSELMVAKKLARNFISSEIDKDFCERIDRKLDLEVLTFVEGDENGKSD